MDKIGIIYESKHKGNTKKLLDAIKNKYPSIELLTTAEVKTIDLKAFSAVGFASGIYAGKLDKRVVEVLDNAIVQRQLKKLFVIFTSANGKSSYAQKLENSLKGNADVDFLGYVGTRGFNTFGPFKLVGGIGKGRPNQQDIDCVLNYFEQTILKLV